MHLTKNAKKAFTLVELIVVITILAILATVAFVSYQGYTASARDTKRESAISDIVSKLTTVRAQSNAALSAFSSGVTARELTAGNLAGVTAATVKAAGKYGAGDVNYTVLGLKAEDFKDGTTAYKIGWTEYKGGVFEIAGTLQGDGPAPKARLKGTYTPRTTALAIAATVDSTDTKKIKITNATDYGKLLAGDTLNAAAGGGQITAISSDLKTITLSLSAGAAGASLTNVGLAAATESDGLIEGSVTAGSPVTNDGANVPYALAN